MSEAGFTLRGGAEGDPGIWVRPSQVLASGEVCVDLIVPEGLSPAGGRRGARLEGHSSRAARKIFGLEAVVVDNDELVVESLESNDDRSITVKVAGLGALFVAKIHKLSDRLQGIERRQSNKDASDIYRLIASITAGDLGVVFTRLRSDERFAAVTQRALDLLPDLFGTRRSPGVEMCVKALEVTVPQATVEAVFAAYMRELENEL